jgi:uncharacterized protein
MKPADHPEFFRMLPPPGTSRESTIRIGQWGDVFHDGERVERVELARALLRWVSFHPDDDRPILTNGYDWCYVAIDDTPYFVNELREAGGVFRVRLSDDSEELLAAEAFAFDDVGLVAAVKNGRRESRLLKQPLNELAAFLTEGPSIFLDGKTRSLRPRARS